MRALAIVVSLLGILTLCSVIPWSTAATDPKPASDWTQFLKAGVKRATIEDESIPDTEEVDIDYQDSQFQIKPMTSFVGMKPTFMPPFIDPQFFMDKKTALLKGLFAPNGPVGSKVVGKPLIADPAIAPSFFAGKKTAFLSTLFNQLATSSPGSVSSTNTTKVGMERRLIAPWLTTPATVVDPKVMTDKKAAFLDKLFSSFNAATTEEGDSIDSTAVKPTIVPPGFWVPFPATPPVSFEPTIKPTIVPPDFWFPFPTSKTATAATKLSVPTVDPSVYIDKKTKFLNDLMNSLSVPPTLSNPENGVSPRVLAPPTPVPVATFDEKISEFLDKLFEALTTPTSTDISAKQSTAEEIYSPRSIPSSVASTEPNPSVAANTLIDPKDKVMNTIVGELTGIKNNMLDTLTDLLKSQKEAAAMAAPPPKTKPGKKIGPPFAAPFAGLWGPMGKLKPTPDPTIPFQQKIDVLNQVFDMLTNLQKDVTMAVNEAAMPKATSTPPMKNSTNITILDLLKKKLMEMDDSTTSAPQEVKPQVNMYGVPLKYNVRDVDTLNDVLPQRDENRGSRTRNIKMALHQGYQSLPPGTTEMLQAGGGSTAQGKEGGGIKMQKGNMNGRYNWGSERHHHHHNK